MSATVPVEESVRVRVPAKINVSLAVGPTRADGYHDLATVFQAVSLYDELTATWAPAGEVSVTTIGPFADHVRDDEDNLACRAARLLMDRYSEGAAWGADLLVDKAIPVAGGMAGGSADAAAALLACAALWDLDVSPAELRTLGAELGADVPFALLGGAAVGTNRGDELVPVLGRGCFHWVLALSEVGLSTPEVFARHDELVGTPVTPRIRDELMAALGSGDPEQLAASLRNDLTDAACALQPGLVDTLELGRRHGALAGLLSGSGPTCAFLAAGESAAMELARNLRAELGADAVRRVRGPVPGAKLVQVVR
ncbi:MAG: 4-(cytidine 5'-diphospho)-2-C-methyl-D-erythritol kinase [Propionibacteriales bacterium]|nr:4-(cytidine 5'-diphospho)-2-C-methyl-D-erythritol kinase [Propionibacteriales bacterium]